MKKLSTVVALAAASLVAANVYAADQKGMSGMGGMSGMQGMEGQKGMSGMQGMEGKKK
jgi:Spy/CpxP family protein refolding chaperone